MKVWVVLMCLLFCLAYHDRFSAAEATIDWNSMFKKGQTVSLIFVGDGAITTEGSFSKKFKTKAEQSFPGVNFILNFPCFESRDNFRIDSEMLGFMSGPLLSYLGYPVANIRIYLVSTSSSESGGFEIEKMNALSSFVQGVISNNNSFIYFVHLPSHSEHTEFSNMYQTVSRYFNVPELQLSRDSEDAYVDQLIDVFKQKTWPKPNTASPFSRGGLFEYSVVDYDPEGWLDWQFSPSKRFVSVLVGHEPEKSLTCRFNGTSMGILGILDAGSADILVSVDGGPFQEKKIPACPQQGFSVFGMLLTEILPFQEHVVRLQLPPGQKGKKIAIGKIFINGLPIDKKSTLTPLDYIDSVYQKMPQLGAIDRTNFTGQLPQLANLLKNHKDITIVMLGDSIINDTASSQFQLLLERQYKNKISLIRSVRGGTGIQWFCQENQLEEYVLKYHPALVIIGGISSKSPEEYRTAIQSLKAKSAAEILILPPCFGGVILNQEAGKNAERFSHGLEQIAKDEGVAFFPMLTFYKQYINDHQISMRSLMRDSVHHNDRGAQLLGRLLEQYITAQVTQ